MKQLSLLLIFIVLSIGIASAQDAEETEAPTTTTTPSRTIEGDGFEIDVYFDFLKQGRVGLIGLRGDNIEDAQLSVFNREVDFFSIPEQDGLFALIAASTDQPIRTHEMIVSVLKTKQDEAENLSIAINVTNGGFISGQVVLPPEDELIALLDPQIEEDELNLIYELSLPKTDAVYWGREGFIPPINAELTSPFGAVRVFNETYESVHTGWDFQAGIGEPMLASAGGKVVFEGQVPLRGNYILIDHGQGVYSGYAHLSVSYVTQGQTINTGQVLGLVGTTGRSSSAHAHIEFIVDTRWVDAADFIRMYIP